MDNIVMIPSTEQVARILSKEWFVDGKLLSIAFTLREGETYISVNRPAIDTYHADVALFVESHSQFEFEDKTYKCAKLNVGDLRDISLDAFGETLKFRVEVEPRDTHKKSHAGIFTLFDDKNVKSGSILTSQGKNISADDVLLKVRTQLTKLSVVEQNKLSSEPVK